ncbi:O-linked N-acetylglucosamine transferase, SPINDLY family protein [Arenibaculum pallidiluteum]|uniref:O-linked N-acetylglucosamine transferase, SPINDLY family protein n=1 Tax=Arenibaculum pallidiluteum TaxID=2812559 RepID=UPI001A95C554|nr:glycosyltransferase family 41 protein [Arenibaculum pallidiluteum]
MPDPGELDALAAAALSSGRPDEAARLLQAALTDAPARGASWNNLAAACAAQGDAAAAIRHLGRALRLERDRLPVSINLAVLHLRRGAAAQALAAFDGLDVTERPEAVLLKASALGSLGEPRGAAEVLGQALARWPGRADLHLNRGNLLRSLGDPAGAAQHYRSALAIAPGDADVLVAVGTLLAESNESEAAEGLIGAATGLAPGRAEPWVALGNLRRATGRSAEAAESYRRAVAADPGSAGALVADALMASEAGDPRARRGFRRALRADPGSATAALGACLSNLRPIYLDQAEITRSRESYAAELSQLSEHYAAAPRAERARAAAAVGQGQPFYLAYQGQDDRALQSLYGDLVAGLMAARHPEFTAPLAPRAPDGRIRLGLVSWRMGRYSPVNTTLRGWLDALGPEVDLHLYQTGAGEDEDTRGFRDRAVRFVAGPAGVEAWAETILGDRLDALVHTDIGMDPMAARLGTLRLAPLQAMTPGHPETTGLPTIDLYLSSELMEPPGAQSHYRERLVTLPGLGHAHVPLTPPDIPLTRADFGVPDDAVLFWCCQSLFKYLPGDDDLFARIAARVPRALFLFVRDPRPAVTAVFETRLAAAFARRGLDHRERCLLLPRMDHARFHAVTGLADVFLDNPGWSGWNTVLQAVEKGLPVVRVPGALMRQRHAVAILSRIGIADGVAEDRDAYVETAVQLGLDRSARARLGDAIRAAAPGLASEPALGAALLRALTTGGAVPPAP